MVKKMTLEQRADAAAIKSGYRVNDYGYIVFPQGYIAGAKSERRLIRADATTKAERAVVEAQVKKYLAQKGEHDADNYLKSIEAGNELAEATEALLKARSAK